MATGNSGYFDISGTRGFTVRVYWSEEYDIATAQSVVIVTDVQIKTVNWYGLSYFLDGSISVENAAVLSMSSGSGSHYVRLPSSLDSFASISASSGYDAAPWESSNIEHNSDGSKTVTISVNISGWIAGASGTANGNGWTASGTQTVTLKTIPRKSTVSASNGTLGTPQDLTVTKQDSSFTHTITYKCGSASGTICTKSSDTTVAWTPPLSLAEQNTTGTSVTVALTIETFSGTTSVGTNSISITCAIPSSVVPTVEIAESDPNGYLSKYGGYVQNKSACKVALSASGSYGSTIKSYSISCAGQTASASASAFSLPNAGTITITAKVTDSRGRTATETADITVLAYSNPSVTAISAYRSDASGNADNSGAYMRVTFSASITSLSGENTASYTIQYRVAGTTSWSSVTPSASGYTPSNISTVIAAATGSSFEVRAVAADAFSSSPSAVRRISSAYAYIHNAKSINSMGLGKIAEHANALDMGWDIWLNDRNIYGADGNEAFAPSGYGLGRTTPKLCSDYNAATNIGFYMLSGADALNGPGESTFAYGTLLAERRYGQIHHTARYGNLVALRSSERDENNIGEVASWNPWEYLNPPMNAGVEYRTTERHNGKAVYTKLINFGTCAATGVTSVSMGVGSQYVHDLKVIARRTSDNVVGVLPLYSAAASGIAAFSYLSGTNAVVNFLSNTGTYTCWAVIKYTK